MLWVIIAVAVVLTVVGTLYVMNNPNKGPTAASSTNSEEAQNNSNSSTQSNEAKTSSTATSSDNNQAGDRLPPALDGFTEMIRAAHVDPAFPGENHSANITFTAAPGSIYENVIESLGISIFLFDDATKLVEAKSLLASGVTLEPTKIEESEVGMGLNSEMGDITVSWEEGPLLFLVAASMTEEARKDSKNADILKRAAIMAATMILKTKK
jgi:hypothetical protein